MNNYDLSGLNKEQKEAVLHEKGPLLIIAGAGTGKTHVITSRILHLLLNKKEHHSKILALTFTEKAAEEMSERIDRALPYSYDEIAIHTFHAFCDRILRDYGLDIGLDTSYKLLNQLDQWMFLKKNLFSLDLDYYRPLGNPNKFISALAQHFSRLKDEDISPAQYLKYAENLNEQTEDEKSEKTRINELANTYKDYQTLLLKNNLLDFNDLHYYVIRLFEERPSVLSKYQDRFKNILVDEFQDTNRAQSKIVFMLGKKYKNITVVGDDDQSIYRWRGASMSTINDFENRFSDIKKIVLKQNYRSTSAILNTSHELIKNNNPKRLEHTHKIDKRLTSNIEHNSPVSIHQFNNYFEENEFIIKKIISVINENNSEFSFKDFAILVRAHNHAKSIIEELKQNKIPFEVQNPQSLFTLPEIKDLIALISFLANQNDDMSLYRILTIEHFNIPMERITEYMSRRNKTNEQLYKIISDENENVKMKEVVNMLDELIKLQKDKNVSAVLAKFLQDSKYIQHLQKNESYENNEKIIHIGDFLRMVNEFETENRSNSPYSFLDYIDLLEEAGAKLEPTVNESDNDAVQILSVHAAKGLEFPFVFIPSVVKNRFPGINKKDPIEIPEDLLIDDMQHDDMHLHEERRLFYVACTRAKRQLFISHSTYYEGTRKWKPSIFIDEIKKSGETEYVDHTDSEENSPEKIVNVKKPAEFKQTDKRQKFYNLSYSKIDAFKTCPLKFKFRYIYKIPSSENHAANFGTSIHNTLNKFYDHLKNGKDPSMNLLTDLYEANWEKNGYESRAHENTRKKKGYEMLKNFYEQNDGQWVIPHYLERPFKIKVDNYCFTGRIDRIDKLENGTYEIIDYKTGRLKKNKSLKSDLQLSIYALAGRDVYNLPVSKLSLYFIEDNEKVSTERNEEQLEKAADEIKSLACDINNSKFEANPGFACKFCEYKRICNKSDI